MKEYYPFKVKLWLVVLIIFVYSLIILESKTPEFNVIEIKKIAEGFLFTEGPCWKNEGYLVFSDIQGDTIYKWSEKEGVEIFLKPSGNSNGLALDNQGRILIAQHGKRQVARLEKNNQLTVLASQWNGKKLNSPNDITVKSDGIIYFTDPPYGIKRSEEELGFNGIYRIIPDKNILELLDKSLIRPNGIALSKDEKILYIVNSDKSKSPEIFAFDINDNGLLLNKRLFVSLSLKGEEFDGIKVDVNENVYAACSGGFIAIFSNKGELLKKINLPEAPRNLCFGENEKIIFVAAGKSIYKITLE